MKDPLPYELKATSEEITHVYSSADTTHAYILLFLCKIHVTHAGSELTV